MYDYFIGQGTGIIATFSSLEEMLAFQQDGEDLIGELKGLVDATDGEIIDFLIEAFDGNFVTELAEMLNADNGNRIKVTGFQASEYTDDTIMFTPEYPWVLTPEEKELTEDSLMDYMISLAEKLGIPASCVGYQEVKYYG